MSRQEVGGDQVRSVNADFSAISGGIDKSLHVQRGLGVLVGAAESKAPHLWPAFSTLSVLVSVSENESRKGIANSVSRYHTESITVRKKRV